MTIEKRTPRRWFRFSLRTLFVVVTVFAVWLGWELSFIKERKASIRLIRDKYGSVYTSSDLADRPVTDLVSIPFWRRMLGDEAVQMVRLTPAFSDNDLRNVQRIFPEADSCIIPWGPLAPAN